VEDDGAEGIEKDLTALERKAHLAEGDLRSGIMRLQLPQRKILFESDRSELMRLHGGSAYNSSEKLDP
jgi:hypothetical protein